MKDLVVAGQKFLRIFLQSCMLTAKQYCAYIAVCEFLDLKICAWVATLTHSCEGTINHQEMFSYENKFLQKFIIL